MSVQFLEPRSLDEAVELLSRHAPDTALLAGGTDLIVQARQGIRPLPSTLVHLGRITGLDEIFVDGDGVLRTGALATHRQVERSSIIKASWTALADASTLVGSPATRHVGTIGGNLCNASPAMELGGPLLAFDARVRLIGRDGAREVPLKDFLLGPRQTDRREDEVLTEVLVPPVDQPSGSAYVRLEFRRAMEIAIVGASAVVAQDRRGAISDCRIALTAIAPVVIRVPEAERRLEGTSADSALLAEAGELAADASSPIDDVRAPADYRRDMVKVFTVRALESALERIKKG